jgi:hypothetical protein
LVIEIKHNTRTVHCSWTFLDTGVMSLQERHWTDSLRSNFVSVRPHGILLRT